MGSLKTLLGEDELDDLDEAEVEALRQLAAAPPRHNEATAQLEPGTRLTEHLTIERHLGAGAMGTVFVAHDDRLERRVAVKLHLGSSERELLQLEREARALAKISHPNVLAVHEVGTAADRVFAVTEYVEGLALDEWLGQPRSRAEIVEVFAAAAEGLAAVHAASLVHRDFKPSNVLIGDDGRVRVADFGLAQSIAGDSGMASSSDDVAGSSAGTLRTHAAAGTPAYMAPEQFGGHASSRSDQFSLCVALAEALTGAHPYGGRPSRAVSPDDFSLGGGARRVPRRLAAVVRRGTALDPDARFPSMDVLAAELRRTIAPRRARYVGGGIVASAGIACALWLWGPSAVVCRNAGSPIAEVWSEARATELEDAFARAHPVGAQAWAPLHQRLSAYAERWGEERGESCRATRVAQTQSERAFEISMACFERRRAELDATLRALSRVDGVAVSEAWRAVPPISALGSCRDPAQLVAWQEHAPLSREAAADLAYVQTLEVIGELEQAQARLAELTERAEAIDDEDTQLQARLRRAQALFGAGDVDAGMADAEAAYFGARRLGNHDAAREAAFLLGGSWLEKGDRGAAGVWLLMLRDLEGPDRIFGRRVWLEARLLEERGESDAAIELLRSALDRLDDDEVEHRLLVLDGLNTAYDAAGRPGLALGVIDEALALARETAGDYGSIAWPLLSNRGLVLSQLDRHQEAIASHREAIALLEALTGPDVVDASGTRLNLALALVSAGRPREALELLPAIIEATARSKGDDHPDVALVLEVRGVARLEVGEAEAALTDFTRALAIARQSHGPTSPDAARYLAQQARALRALGRREAERQTALASLGVYDAIGQTDHPQARVVRLDAAGACAAVGREEEAIALLERALGEDDLPEQRRGVVELARQLGREPRLAARAAAILERVGPQDPTDDDAEPPAPP